jgi:hypothetical protein
VAGLSAKQLRKDKFTTISCDFNLPAIKNTECFFAGVLDRKCKAILVEPNGNI